MSRANPVDEGLIHAWIEGQLPPDEAARVERLVATDAEWGAAVAEARGLIAASSRILGALDDVPAVRDGTSGTSSTSSTSGMRSTSGASGARVWWKSPLMGAAAGIVLVAGVSSAVWLRGDFSRAISAAPDAIGVDRADPAANAPAVGAAAAAPVPSASNDSQAKAAPSDARRDAVPPRARNELDASSALAERKQANDPAGQRAAAPPPVVPPPKSAAAPPVGEQVVGATTVMKDSVGGASGARADGNRGGGRAGIGSGVQANAAMELSAKVMDAAPSVDARLAGCWMPISPLARKAEERERAAEGQIESSVVLRFIGGVMTDVVAASSPVRPQDVAQRSAVTRVNAPPVAAITSGFAAPAVISATVVPVARADSSFTAEWIAQGARNVATFTVRGDTLRGTSRTLPADSARAGAPFVATRVTCAR